MARVGSMPSEGNILEFLKEQRHDMFAWERAEQQVVEGIGGLGSAAAGSHAMRPSKVILQSILALANSRTFMLAKKDTMKNILKISNFR